MKKDSLENKEPKQYSIIPLLFLIVIGFGVYSYNTYDPKPANTINYSKLKEKAKQHFNSEEEPTTQVASWVNDNTFSVAVIDKGDSSRDGYAKYVCQKLIELGLEGQVSKVMVADIKTLSTNYKVLGYASCK